MIIIHAKNISANLKIPIVMRTLNTVQVVERFYNWEAMSS